MSLANALRHWALRWFSPGRLVRTRYDAFRRLLDCDQHGHELIAQLERIYHDREMVDFARVVATSRELSGQVAGAVEALSRLAPGAAGDLDAYYRKIDFYCQLALAPMTYSVKPPFALRLEDIGDADAGLAGGKAYNLARIVRHLELPVPAGFVITANACNLLLEENDLRDRIDRRLARIDISSPRSLEEAAAELRALVQAAEVPEAVSEAIAAVQQGLGLTADALAVRSSAVGEDGRISFAGQYRSVLNVAPDDLLIAYKDVVASRYSARALYYRINNGLSDEATPMAVLVVAMIPAAASGVIYTRDPDPAATVELEPYLSFHTIRGLGELLVDGSVSPGLTTVSRTRPQRILTRQAGEQSVVSVVDAQGGTRTVDEGASAPVEVPDEMVILKLADWALQLEDHYDGPQDIEWCVDDHGRPYILQSRPLRVAAADHGPDDCAHIQVTNPVLLTGGRRACSGAGAGVVQRIDPSAGPEQLESLPERFVLVARTASPDYVKFMGRLSAVVTDEGSVAGHFASVAREFGVPTLVGTHRATEVLTPGREVTVAADRGVVYDGRVADLTECADRLRRRFDVSPFLARTKKVLALVSPLNLIDPEAENFAPSGCRSFHDILRYAHEQAVRAMFELSERSTRRAMGAKQLISDLPLIAYVLDLGGGLRRSAGRKGKVAVDQVRSDPLQAVWRGLANPGIYWDPAIKHYNWQDIDPMAEGVVRPDYKLLGSYAIVSRDYLNFNIHFGYHFVVLDTLCTDAAESNYVNLRFRGGGAEAYARHLRIQFMQEVLQHRGFRVEVQGDLLTAHLARTERGTVEEALELIGILLGATRVMDMTLRDGAQVEPLVAKFLAGDYDLSPVGK